MSKIAALQLPTLALSESRLDYYLKACKDSGVNLVVLGEYVINSFFIELLHMPKKMIKEQSEIKKENLIKLSKKYDIQILAPVILASERSCKKLCLQISPTSTQSYEQQILMPYSHWNEEKFFSNKTQKVKLFTFSFEKIKCALIFGFEAHFDIFWQMIVEEKVDLVIIPTASTFQTELRWKELLKTRAFLSSSAILRVNRIGTSKNNDEEWNFYGDTMYIDAFGEVQESLGDKEEMLIIEPSKATQAKNLWHFDKILKKQTKI